MKINEKQLRNVIKQVIKENNNMQEELGWIDQVIENNDMERFKSSLIAYDAQYGNGQLISFLRGYCGSKYNKKF